MPSASTVFSGIPPRLRAWAPPAILLILSVLTLSAQQPAAASSSPQTASSAAAPPAVPTLAVTSREVLLDVSVVDAAGRPVTGLRASDFTVTEDGVTQTVKRLEEHLPMSADDTARMQSGPSLPPNTFTNYTPMANSNARVVILLDALDTPVTAQEYLRNQLIAFLKSMQPGPAIAIFQLADDIRLIQGFTADRQALLAAAQSSRDMPSLFRPVDGNRVEYRESKHELVRASMQMLGRYLAGFPGRKSLIWFTGDLPVFTGQNPLSLIGSGHAYPFKDTFSLDELPDDPGSLADEQTLSRVAVDPVDARGLEGGALLARMSKDIYNLESVAHATGGKAFYNTNGFKEILADIVSNSSNYYSLSYAPANRSWDGQFRHIKVTVDRPNLRVQHREGYFAYNRDAAEQRQAASLARRIASRGGQPAPVVTTQSSGLPGQEDQSGALVRHPKGGFDAAMLLGAVPPTELVFTASLAPGDAIVKLKKNAPLPQGNYLRAAWQDKPFRNDTILFNLNVHHVKWTQTGDGIRHALVDCVTIVYSQDGAPVNSLLSTAQLDVDEAKWHALLHSGLPVVQQIAVPVKGNYFLRLGVHDQGYDRIGALEIPVDQIKIGIRGQGL
jgi:VWFA-related protein